MVDDDEDEAGRGDGEEQTGQTEEAACVERTSSGAASRGDGRRRRWRRRGHGRWAEATRARQMGGGDDDRFFLAARNHRLLGAVEWEGVGPTSAPGHFAPPQPLAAGVSLSAEEKAAKDKRTKELIAAYRNRQNMVIDPKTKAECNEALKEGDELMNTGRLKQALPYYEKVMNAVDFKTELHGRAALQWSICLDSLCRSREAMSMYSKLKNHPNAEISKKANMFVFSFQAMDFMKVSSTPVVKTTGYESYFTKFGGQKNYYASLDEPELGLDQIIPYMLFLVSPIFLVAFVALRKSFQL